jgi:hypothetical protein
MENGPFIGDLPIQIMIFHSYVCLPEGNKHINKYIYINPPSNINNHPNISTTSCNYQNIDCKINKHQLLIVTIDS